MKPASETNRNIAPRTYPMHEQQFNDLPRGPTTNLELLNLLSKDPLLPHAVVVFSYCSAFVKDENEYAFDCVTFGHLVISKLRSVMLQLYVGLLN